MDYIAKRYDLEEDISCDYLLPFSFGAIFSVSKGIILERPISFYQKLLNLLLEDWNKLKIDSGYIYERLWLSIFKFQKYNSKYKKLPIKDNKLKYHNIRIENNEAKFSVRSNDIIFIIIKINKIDFYLSLHKNVLKFNGGGLKRAIRQDIHYNPSFYTKITVPINIKINNKTLEIFINKESKSIISYNFNRIVNIESIKVENNAGLEDIFIDYTQKLNLSLMSN